VTDPHATQLRRVALVLCAAIGLTPGALGAQPAGSCTPPDTTAPWAQVARAWRRESPGSWSNDSLRRVLLSLAVRDQAARADFGAPIADTAFVRQLISIDDSIARELHGIFARFGLPTRSLVGAAGVDALMLIVQHSSSLQDWVLPRARDLAPGEVAAEKLAMLEDRWNAARGIPQRFGTHFDAGSDGVMRLAPVGEWARGLEERRAAAGIMPMRDYVCLFEEAGMKVDRSSLPH
jgi:hypothetical protein